MMNEYPSSAFKRAKPDHSSLRTLTAYGTTPSHSHYPPPHHQYNQSPNAEMMHTFFQQYGTTPGASPKGSYSNPHQSYWSGAHEKAAGAAVWQQQQQHYR